MNEKVSLGMVKRLNYDLSRYLEQHRVGSSLQDHVSANVESTVQIS